MDLVSVIIPTYKRSDYLLRSIQSILNQTYSPIEIIVVDDNGLGSEDQRMTQAQLQNFIDQGKIQYIPHVTNRNGSAARNTGLKASKGSYINFLDDDDVFEPTKIEMQVKRLEKVGDQFDACYCNTVILNPRRTIYTKNNKEGDLCYELLLGKVNFNTSTILFRRKALLDINGWDERYKRHQDWELMVRFFRNHQICIAESKSHLVKKYATTNIITRNPLSAIGYRDFFLGEIKQDIEKCPNPKRVYRAQMEDLALGLMSNGAKKEGREYFKRIFKYGWPSMIAFIKYIYYIFI